jgi:phosphate uptake regulator
MKLRAKGSDEADLLRGRIELDPAGEGAPSVTLDDGHSLGSLVDVLDRFSVEEVSSEEKDAIREAFRGRDLVALARHLDEIVDHAENAIRRLLGECESFREHAAACGFQVTPCASRIENSRAESRIRQRCAAPDVWPTLTRT